jgi:drug/metabolite transporter (DMT)-like permease
MSKSSPARSAMDSPPVSIPPSLSAAQGRLCLFLAALLWSTSGGFSKVLTRDTPLGLNTPEVHGLVMAFYRALFAGLALVPLLRRSDLSFRPLMIGMVACFAIMNGLFVSALALGTAANAIFLQYTAPMWIYVASVWWLGEPADRRSSVALVIGLVGIAVIVLSGERAQLPIIAIALGSGVAYAGVILFLRVLRNASSRWLTILNHLGGALALLPFLWCLSPPAPTSAQMLVLFLFGALQMGLPYWLAARGLRVVSPQEAGIITLLEPILNPIWAYLVAREVPLLATWVGGAFIVGALAWRYWPRRRWGGS